MKKLAPVAFWGGLFAPQIVYACQGDLWAPLGFLVISALALYVWKQY